MIKQSLPWDEECRGPPIGLLFLLVGIVAQQHDAGLRNFYASGLMAKLNVRELVRKIVSLPRRGVSGVQDDSELPFLTQRHGGPALLVGNGQLMNHFGAKSKAVKIQYSDVEVLGVCPGIQRLGWSDLQSRSGRDRMLLSQGFEAATQLRSANQLLARSVCSLSSENKFAESFGCFHAHSLLLLEMNHGGLCLGRTTLYFKPEEFSGIAVQPLTQLRESIEIWHVPVLDSRISGRAYSHLECYGANAAIPSFGCEQLPEIFNP
jgi:hypothetical protein